MTEQRRFYLPVFRWRCSAAFWLLLSVWPVCVAQAQDSEPAFSMDALLEQVRKGRATDAKHDAARLREFRQRKQEQQKLLQKLVDEQARLERISANQEQQFEDNEQSLSLLQDRLDERLGSLKELFGVLQQVSSDARAQFANSITQLHFPERDTWLGEFSAKMGQTADLPSISEIEQLWFELQREMTVTGRNEVFRQTVVTSRGEQADQDVIRIGAFNLIADGRYLRYIPETGRVIEPGRQPAGRFLERLVRLESGGDEPVMVSVDPAQGQLLALLVQSPSLLERVEQGGVIGYLIISLGIAGLLVAIVRLLMLTRLNVQIEHQLQHPEEQTENALGRILAVYDANRNQSLDTLELKLGEAVMREIPRVNRGLSLLKVIAAVAPLMGLLGTVTGMIITFQAITLFGTGDPKLMAGGISQALVTTVLGLTVAIPTLLLHNLLQGRAAQINDVLQQESIALVAAQAEAADRDRAG